MISSDRPARADRGDQGPGARETCPLTQQRGRADEAEHRRHEHDVRLGVRPLEHLDEIYRPEREDGEDDNDRKRS